MYSFNNNWQRVQSFPVNLAEDEMNSITQALDNASSRVPEQQPESGNNSKGSIDELNFIDRKSFDDCAIEIDQNDFVVDPDQSSVVLLPTDVPYVESNKVLCTSNHLVDHCSSVDCSASVHSNVSSGIQTTATEQAEETCCCHTFQYDESWSIQSGTASGEVRTFSSPISLFAPASTIEFRSKSGKDRRELGACIDVIKSDSTVSGLTTLASLATEISKDVTDCKEGTEVRLDEMSQSKLDDVTEEGTTMEVSTEMDTIKEEEEEHEHCIEYVEETAAFTHGEVGVNKEAVLVETEKNLSVPKQKTYSSVTTETLSGSSQCKEDAKSSFFQRVISKQRISAKERSNDMNKNESTTSVILQMNNDIQHESDEFELIFPSSNAAEKKHEVSSVASEPHTNAQDAKKNMIPRVSSNATASTKDISVFTLRSVNSEQSVATSETSSLGRFSLTAAPFQRSNRKADIAATIDDTSLLLHEEIEGEMQSEDDEDVPADGNDCVDESMNVEMIEDDFIKSPHHFKRVMREKSGTNKFNVLSRWVGRSWNH